MFQVRPWLLDYLQAFVVLFSELWSAEEHGKVYDPWLIIERVENVAMDPRDKKANVPTFPQMIHCNSLANTLPSF